MSPKLRMPTASRRFGNPNARTLSWQVVVLSQAFTLCLWSDRVIGLEHPKTNWRVSKMRTSVAFAIGAIVLLAPSAATAHFVLLEPANSLVQDERGDPQKLAPCGGSSNGPGIPTNAITEARGGDMLHIKIREAVFHPGHYRVAMAVNSLDELPPDPETTKRDSPRGLVSVSAKIDPNPKPPLLADGLFVHTERPAPGSFWETDIRLPNINCDKCTLQVIQWMAEHRGRPAGALNPDGDYSYHHCAHVKITANPALPIDTSWPGQSSASR
jgi:hypothetical protein